MLALSLTLQPKNRGSTGQRQSYIASLVRLQQGFRDGLGPVSWAVKWSEHAWQGSTTASTPLSLSRKKEKKHLPLGWF